jgi:hypothetical protein
LSAGLEEEPSLLRELWCPFGASISWTHCVFGPEGSIFVFGAVQRENGFQLLKKITVNYKVGIGGYIIVKIFPTGTIHSAFTGLNRLD